MGIHAEVSGKEAKRFTESVGRTMINTAVHSLLRVILTVEGAAGLAIYCVRLTFRKVTESPGRQVLGSRNS